MGAVFRRKTATLRMRGQPPHGTKRPEVDLVCSTRHRVRFVSPAGTDSAMVRQKSGRRNSFSGFPARSPSVTYTSTWPAFSNICSYCWSPFHWRRRWAGVASRLGGRRSRLGFRDLRTGVVANGTYPGKSPPPPLRLVVVARKKRPNRLRSRCRQRIRRGWPTSGARGVARNLRLLGTWREALVHMRGDIARGTLSCACGAVETRRTDFAC